jgi:hypothetical protein
MTKFEVIKNWVENIADNDDLICVVRQVNSYDGSLEDYTCYDMGELDELFCNCKVSEFLGKLAEGFDLNADGFRDTVWGIESVNYNDVAEEIRSNSEEVAEAIENNIENDIWIPASLENELEEE